MVKPFDRISKRGIFVNKFWNYLIVTNIFINDFESSMELYKEL